MSISRILTVLLVASLGMAMVAGCGAKADENKSVSDAQAEAKDMNADQLRKMAETYKDAVLAKQKEVEALAAKLKKIPITKMLGEDAKAIKTETGEIKDSLGKLKKLMDVYVKELKAKGDDASGLGS